MHDIPHRIRTRRLDLVATSLEHLGVELKTPEQLGALLGALVPPGWPPGLYDRDAMEFFHARLVEYGTAAIGWYGWYGVLRAVEGRPATLVASCGYLGPPADDGTVEIGYSVVAEHRGHGYAKECTEALTAQALAVPGVRRIVAEASVENAASVAVLRGCGFHRAGPGREAGYYRYAYGGAR
jgi:ribosomal-protein-alanine N-acetyltransferase